MAKFEHYKVEILIEEDSDLEKKIQQSAQLRGITFQQALQEAVNIGIWNHIRRNIDLVDRCCK